MMAIHFHMLWLDGVYVEATELPRRELRLHRARAPTTAQLTQLAATRLQGRHAANAAR
ncbi:hypothetical protein [Pseudomonas aeruginosa]|uniref:hypothetical protein n=1 Tax=Pseudomonas aeruginosa TaxID=287 RepID=UPI0021C3A574|nr:hypothetical protein [Pseudomonas aeruginosa]